MRVNSALTSAFSAASADRDARCVPSADEAIRPRGKDGQDFRHDWRRRLLALPDGASRQGGNARSKCLPQTLHIVLQRGPQGRQLQGVCPRLKLQPARGGASSGRELGKLLDQLLEGIEFGEGGDHAFVILGQRLDRCVLAAEVQVERALAHAGLGADLIDRHVYATLREALACGVKDMGSAARGGGGGYFWHESNIARDCVAPQPLTKTDWSVILRISTSGEHMSRCFASALIGCAVMMTSGIAAAQAAGDASAGAAASTGNQLEEVVVTATKRPERVRDISGSVTAFDEAALESLGAESYSDYLTRTPGVVFNASIPGNSPAIIRGVATTTSIAQAQGTTGYFIDDVPMTDPFYSAGIPDIDTFDVDNVTVLYAVPRGRLDPLRWEARSTTRPRDPTFRTSTHISAATWIRTRTPWTATASMAC